MTETFNVGKGRDAEVLRAAMVDALVAAKAVTSKRVEAAMRRVPRHLFTPGADLASAYADDVVRYEHDGSGQCVSSVSAPWIVARMLEDARIRPGMKVLEIGSGGYNAALLSYLVGRRGRVVSMDIDVKVTSRAMAALARTEYCPLVVVGDGTYGLARCAPYERIIAAAAAPDVPQAWVEQLVEGGRLVVPLSIRGQQRIVTFVKQDGMLRSTSLFYGGFVRFRGAAAARTREIALEAGSTLSFDDGLPPDAEQLADVLSGPVVEMPTGVVVASGEPFDALQLYLAVTLSSCAYVSFGPEFTEAGRLPAAQAGCPVLAAGSGSIAYLTVRKVTGGLDARHEFVAVGLGPLAAPAASELAEHVALWDSQLRGRGPARITVHPAGTPAEGCEGERVVAREQSMFGFCFPHAFPRGRL
jgi:protein-L-isoaspartate(D-aspartate) O-methyltransferase